MTPVADPIEQARQDWLDAQFVASDHSLTCGLCARSVQRCAEGRILQGHAMTRWTVWYQARVDAGVLT